MSGMDWALVVLAATIVGAAVGLLMWRHWRDRRRKQLLAKAKTDFHRRREPLEAQFVKVASASGKPRGLQWVDCDFENPVVYARDRQTGQLSAFVGVTIAFEAVAGGGMEENENVKNLRAATAVFHFENGRWSTQGRAIFNLNPAEAVQHYHANLERIVENAVNS